MGPASLTGTSSVATYVARPPGATCGVTASETEVGPLPMLIGVVSLLEPVTRVPGSATYAAEIWATPAGNPAWQTIVTVCPPLTPLPAQPWIASEPLKNDSEPCGLALGEFEITVATRVMPWLAVGVFWEKATTDVALVADAVAVRPEVATTPSGAGAAALKAVSTTWIVWSDVPGPTV